jgi:hypothetical protein
MLGNPNSIIDVDVPVEGPTVSVITQLCRGRKSDCFGPMCTSAATVLNCAGAALRTLCVSQIDDPTARRPSRTQKIRPVGWVGLEPIEATG